MTSQQDTELEEILEHLLIDYDYDVKDKDDVTFNRAIQALTSWKDKEVRKELEYIESEVSEAHMILSPCGYRHTIENILPPDVIEERIKSLQSQGGKNE